MAATGTAQTQRITTDPIFTGQSTFASDIAALRNKIASGSIINADDINAIKTYTNNVQGHYHQHSDTQRLKTYGNTGAGTNIFRTGTTEAPTSAALVTASNVAAASSINTVMHNNIRDVLISASNHRHITTDYTTS